VNSPGCSAGAAGGAVGGGAGFGGSAFAAGAGGGAAGFAAGCDGIENIRVNSPISSPLSGVVAGTDGFDACCGVSALAPKRPVKEASSAFGFAISGALITGSVGDSGEKSFPPNAD
jgi:hypothetical protein